MDISAWLYSLSLPQYEQTFRDNAIDLAILPDLTETDLEQIGVLLGHRAEGNRALDAAVRPIAAIRQKPARGLPHSLISYGRR